MNSKNKKTMTYNKDERVELNNQMQLALNLEYNMVDNAKYVLEHPGIPKDFREIKIYIILCSSFYELFFKYKLGLINPSLIWKYPEKFNLKKHNEADFVSKDASELVAYAINFKWINKKDEDIIRDTIDLRNKLIHFSLCEQDSDGNTRRVVAIDINFFDKNIEIVKKLLSTVDKDLQKNYMFLDMKEKKHNIK